MGNQVCAIEAPLESQGALPLTVATKVAFEPGRATTLAGSAIMKGAPACAAADTRARELAGSAPKFHTTQFPLFSQKAFASLVPEEGGSPNSRPEASSPVRPFAWNVQVTVSGIHSESRGSLTSFRCRPRGMGSLACSRVPGAPSGPSFR